MDSPSRRRSGRPERLRGRCDGIQLGSDLCTRARRRESVAMAADDPEGRAPARRVAVVAAGDQGRAAERIDVSDVEAPGDELRERLAGRGRQSLGVAVADHGDPHGSGVEPARLRPDHRLVDPAGAPLEDPPEGIDEEVVADVLPAVRAHVVGVDRADDRGHVVGRVAVRRVGVVHEDHLRRVRVARVPRAAASRLPPARPRHDLGLIGRGLQRTLGLQRRAVGGDERDAHAADGSADAHLQAIAACDPVLARHDSPVRLGPPRASSRATTASGCCARGSRSARPAGRSSARPADRRRTAPAAARAGGRPACRAPATVSSA